MTRPRVVLAEEDEDLRLLLTLWLSPAYASLGFGRFEQVLDHAEELEPSLVLVDVSRPGLDAAELLRDLRSHPCLAETPVLFLAWRELPFARRSARAGCLVKPFSRKDLLAAVADMLEPSVLRVSR